MSDESKKGRCHGSGTGRRQRHRHRSHVLLLKASDRNSTQCMCGFTSSEHLPVLAGPDPDGRCVIARGGELSLIRELSGKLDLVLVVPILLGSITAMALTSAGRTAVIGSCCGNLILVDIPSGRLMYSTDAHTGSVHDLTLSPQGIAATSSYLDPNIRLWSVQPTACHQLKCVQRHARYAIPLAITPDSRSLVSGGSGRVVDVWDVSTGELRVTLEGHTGDKVTCVAVAQNGRYLAAGSDDQLAIIWSLETGKRLSSLPQRQPVGSVTFIRADQWLAVDVVNNGVAIWRWSDGALVHCVGSTSQQPRPLRVTKDCRCLFAAMSQQVVEVAHLDEVISEYYALRWAVVTLQELWSCGRLQTPLCPSGLGLLMAKVLQLTEGTIFRSIIMFLDGTGTSDC